MSTLFSFLIPDIRCNNCAEPIRTLLNQHLADLDLKSICVNVDDKTLIVESLDSNQNEMALLEQLNALLGTIGHQCLLGASLSKKPKPQSFISSEYFKGILGLFFGFTITISMWFWPTMPFYLMLSELGLSCALTAYLGFDSYRAAWRALTQRKTLTMDTLFSISTLTIIFSAFLSLKFPNFPHMFDASLLIFGFRHLGKGIEASLQQKMAFKIRFQDRANETASRLSDGNLVLAEALEIGDEVVFNPNEVICVDGESLNEGAMVFKTIVDGSTISKRVKFKEPILAGMRLDAQSPPLHLRVVRASSQSYLARLDVAMAQAELERSKIEKKADQYLQYFIPLVLGLSVSLGLGIGVLLNPIAGIQMAVTVLVSACPCTLGLITPLLMKIGIKKGFEHGICYKNGEMLERAAEVDTVVFDLNGTLTTGVPEVASFYVADGLSSPHEILSAVDRLEANNSHAIALALKRYCHANLQNPMLNPPPMPELIQGGLKASIDGTSWAIGNADLLEAEGIVRPEHQRRPEGTFIYVVKNNALVAYFEVIDPLRSDALSAIEALKNQKKQIFICTGADKATAYRYAKKLGLSEKHVKHSARGGAHDVNPKIKFIESLQVTHQYKVAMVGDAANDALAIEKSHFGIAMHSKSTDEMTKAHAGAVLRSEALSAVINTLAIGKKTLKQIHWALIWSLFYNMASVFVVGGIFLRLGYLINPCLGAAFMILQTSLILFYAHRFKSSALPFKESHQQGVDSHHQMNGLGLARVESSENPVTQDLSEDGPLFENFLRRSNEVSAVLNSDGTDALVNGI